jgi:hypothetical protein
MKNIENPVTVETTGPQAGTRTTHPCFAQIRASRVNGLTNLYDSDFQHNHFVSISIYRSELDRHLNRDWHHSRDELIEVNLSEAQWATFVSSMNVGCGVPCTLSYLHGKFVPQLPDTPDTRTLFKMEMTDAVKKCKLT